jgi:hypothetical protein
MTNKVYLVKTWGPEDGYTNRYVFEQKKEAEAYAFSLGLPDFHETRKLHDEFVQIETLDFVV